MHVAYLLHDDTKDCVILTHRPLWLSFQNHESVWMVPGAISADDEPIARGSIPPPTKKIRPDQAERGSEPAEAEPKPRGKMPLVLVRGYHHRRLEAWQSASLRRPDRSQPRSRLR